MDANVIKTEFTFTTIGRDGLSRTFLVTEDMLERFYITVEEFINRLIDTFIVAWDKIAYEVIKPMMQTFANSFSLISERVEELQFLDVKDCYFNEEKRYKQESVRKGWQQYLIPKYRSVSVHKNIKQIPYMARRG